MSNSEMPALFVSQTLNRRDRALAFWALKPMAYLLRTGDPAATIDRLFTSQHVTDLQLIIAVAFVLLLLVLVGGLWFAIENQIQTQWTSIALRKSNWIFVHVAFASAASILTFFTPVFAVFGAVLAWAYQVGSARLGVVDLFACEISTLCRVATVVDTVHRFVEDFSKGPPEQHSVSGDHPRIGEFTSQENYFTVFDSDTRDLQQLEARIVINITAFYTYMKAFRDSMRTLAMIRPESVEFAASSKVAPAAGPWQNNVRDVIYMLFLAFESARLAVADLVEFEPDRAERTIVILISELEAYRFLCAQFTDEQDVRHQRLMLRFPEYKIFVPKLDACVEAGRALEKKDRIGPPADDASRISLWEPAYRLLPELRRRYQAATSSINS